MLWEENMKETTKIYGKSGNAHKNTEIWKENQKEILDENFNGLKAKLAIFEQANLSVNF